MCRAKADAIVVSHSRTKWPNSKCPLKNHHAFWPDLCSALVVRTTVLGVLFTTAVLGLPAGASAQPAGAIDSAHANYYRALAALAPAELPQAYRSLRPARGEEVSLALRNARLSQASLSPSEQKTLGKLLARPTDFGDDYAYTVPEATPICTTNFCIHYVTTTADAPPLDDVNQNGAPDIADDLGKLLESSRAALIALGYSYHGIDDEGLGGDTRLDVYIKAVGSDFAAAVVPEDFKSFSPLRLSSYVIVNTAVFTELPPGYLDGIIPHELKHTFDAATFGNAPAWLFESSAVWVENEIDDDSSIHTMFFPCWYLWPEFSLDVPRDKAYPSDPRDNGMCEGAPYHIYGSATFWFHASVVVGTNLNRDVWEHGGAACSSAVDFEGPVVRRCVADTIAQVFESHGEDLGDVYADFTRKNYKPRRSSVLLEAETPGELFAWPNDVFIEQMAATYPASGSGNIDHWSARYFDLAPPADMEGVLHLDVDGPGGESGAGFRAALILTQGGELTEVPLIVNALNGDATTTIPSFGNETSLAALVLTNTSPVDQDRSTDGLAFSWSATFELASAGNGGTAGASGGAAGDTGMGASGGSSHASPASGDDSGCGCRLPSRSNSELSAGWFLLLAIGLSARRRRLKENESSRATRHAHVPGPVGPEHDPVFCLDFERSGFLPRDRVRRKRR
jgi:hypothetical protein